LDVYSHVIKGLGQAAMKRLDEVLEPELLENVGKMSATDPEEMRPARKFEPS